MSSENISLFYQKVQESPELQRRVQEIDQASLQQIADALSSLSAEEGPAFTSEEFRHVAQGPRELTDEELENTAGGILPLVGMAVVGVGVGLIGYFKTTKEPGTHGMRLA